MHIAVSRAIYATGWDGAVTLEADVHGHWTVLNDQVNGPPGPVSGAGATALLNINTATADQLSTLPMIGLKRARDVVEFRTQHGPFATIDDIIRVPGIGPGTFKAIRPLIRVN